MFSAVALVLTLLEAPVATPEGRLRAIVQNAQHTGWPVPYIPNGYRKGTPVPAMPGAGEPYLDSHEPLARSSFATDRR